MFSNITNIFQKKINKINFEDMQLVVKNPTYFLLINTMNAVEQDCLILTTLPYESEEKTINDMLNSYDLTSKKIVIYGKNANDETLDKKYSQLTGLGFNQVYLYCGGLFEWLMLQDIYGFDEFQTTKKQLDILKYKPERKLKL